MNHSDTEPGTPEPQDGRNPGDSTTAGSAELAALQNERAQLEEQLRRTLADAANMRRRAQKEAEDARRRIIEGFSQELLPVLDSFGFALQANDQGTIDPASVVQGVRMVQTLLLSMLERHGLQEIAVTAGQPFDPGRHEAVAVEAVSGIAAGNVVRVLMKGYLLGDRVLRHARVVVAGEAGKPGEPKST